jgi:hypothetical protein
MVTGEDPFADDLETDDPDGFADPASYDFSIAHFTDTQYLSEGAVEQETAEERAIWESAYSGIVDWIAENADSRKISYVAHTGDVIENNIRKPATPELERQIIGEFELSSRQQGVLDAAGVPNGVIAGNHDNPGRSSTGTTAPTGTRRRPQGGPTPSTAARGERATTRTTSTSSRPAASTSSSSGSRTA